MVITNVFTKWVEALADAETLVTSEQGIYIVYIALGVEVKGSRHFYGMVKGSRSLFCCGQRVKGQI